MIGRTHGVHAEPITFGFKMANWYSETQRNISRFKAASEDLRVGKFSRRGRDLSPPLSGTGREDLRPAGTEGAAVSSQVIQRDRTRTICHAGSDCLTLDKIATEIRHLQRTEVREAEEYFQRKAKRLIRDAAQTQSGDKRADKRFGARSALKCAGRIRKRTALARARYFTPPRPSA